MVARPARRDRADDITELVRREFAKLADRDW